MRTVRETLDGAVRRLAAAGIDNPRLDSRLLLAEALGVEKSWLFNHPEKTIDADLFERLLARRLEREPMSSILGRREFWSLDFVVTPDTLAPRPDSETLIEAVLAALPDRSAPLSLVDFGTGTGCLLLTLLSELPNAEGIGIDISRPALAIAGGNAKRLGLADRCRFLCSDWSAALEGRFDLIISNPPYIPSGDIAGLEPEVARFEPLSALDGGADGLDAYRALAAQIPPLLKPGGIGAFEVGAGQAPQVAALLAEAGLTPRGIHRDLGGIERVVTFAC